MGDGKSQDLPGIGIRLREARERAGLTQEQVARLLRIPRPSVTEMETEMRKVTAGELKELARLYKVSTEWILGEPMDNAAKVKMAARKLGALKKEDLVTVLKIIDSLDRRSNPAGAGKNG